jgi:hypothetical protein
VSYLSEYRGRKAFGMFDGVGCSVGLPRLIEKNHLVMKIKPMKRPQALVVGLRVNLSFWVYALRNSYLVDPASSHMLVSKIKPCMSKYKPIYTVKLRMAH